jgi:hypothetical protein
VLSAHAQENVHAETALDAVIPFLREHGRPRHLSCDHDPRWVGSLGGWDGPSAFLRCVHGVQVEPRRCPPHHPQKNGGVQRSYRSSQDECLHLSQPERVEEVTRVTEAFRHHAPTHRPHHGRACGTYPPRQACPTLPERPPLPRPVHADRWLWHSHHRIGARLRGSDGCLTRTQEASSLSMQRGGQKGALVGDAPTASGDGVFRSHPLTRLPFKKRVRDERPGEPSLALMQEHTRSEERVRWALAGQWRRGEWENTP